MKRAVPADRYFDHLTGSLSAIGDKAPGGRHASAATYRTAALRIVRAQYAAACNVGDVATSRYLLDVIASGESLVLAGVR